MFWIFILLVIIGVVYLKSKERNQLKISLKDEGFRKSYIQNLIEEEFQSYLKLDLEGVASFKKKLTEAEERNDAGVVEEVKGQIKFFSDGIVGLKEIKEELQKKNDPIWKHFDFSDQGIIELKEKISDNFSHSASYALGKIRL